MPTKLHDVHHRWVNHATRRWTRQGLTNEAEDDLMDFGVGTSMLFTLQSSLRILILGHSF